MSGLKLSQLAGMWSKDSAFIAYLNDKSPRQSDFVRYGTGSDEIDPAVLIRAVCDIQSRKELDTNRSAATRFDLEIRQPFMAWSTNKVSARPHSISSKV